MNIEKNYYIEINNEPEIVKEIRFNILNRSKDLIFKEDTHQYFWHDKELEAVSNFTHKNFQSKFDTEAVAEKYAQDHGYTKEYWMDVWKWNSLKATTTGTLVHEYGESLGWLANSHPELITDSCVPKYNAEKGWLIPTRGKEESVMKFMMELPKSYHLVLNEARVINEELGYAGTFDMLYYYDGNGDPEKAGLVIFDYKTNKDVYDIKARKYNRKLLNQFNHLYDEPVNMYTLQLSCYQIPLENLGYRVIDRKLIWLKEDGYEKIFVPDVTKILRSLSI